MPKMTYAAQNLPWKYLFLVQGKEKIHKKIIRKRRRNLFNKWLVRNNEIMVLVSAREVEEGDAVKDAG